MLFAVLEPSVASQIHASGLASESDAVVVQDDGTLEATIRTAVRDLRRVGRNVDLIDEEILADAMSEEESGDEE